MELTTQIRLAFVGGLFAIFIMVVLLAVAIHRIDEWRRSRRGRTAIPSLAGAARRRSGEGTVNERALRISAARWKALL